MAKVLIVYGTAYGQTERVALEIARVLREMTHEVSVVRGDGLPAQLAPEDYDGFVVAGSVLLGRHQRYVERFVREHVSLLNARPSAFVSVCGAKAGTDPGAAQTAQTYLEQFLGLTGWRPGLAESFAGALPYTRYSPWVRWMMKLISRRTGRPTDTSRDHEFTDWAAVTRFAERFAAMLAPDRAACECVPEPMAAGRESADELC